ncbi:hypothetical protein [Streptomyces tendae]|uniref:hypothetical protein n=1 Tax=Streptomyces tendae TaxID=1932 RepID=UPI003D70BCDD
MEQKTAAVLAHRSEVTRGALPGLIAGLPPDARQRLFATERYIRHATITAVSAQTELTA